MPDDRHLPCFWVITKEGGLARAVERLDRAVHTIRAQARGLEQLADFAARGLGVCPVSRLGAGDVGPMRGLCLLGSSEGVKAENHAIRSRRGQHHPLVKTLMAAAAARADT